MNLLSFSFSSFISVAYVRMYSSFSSIHNCNILLSERVCTLVYMLFVCYNLLIFLGQCVIERNGFIFSKFISHIIDFFVFPSDCCKLCIFEWQEWSSESSQWICWGLELCVGLWYHFSLILNELWSILCLSLSILNIWFSFSHPCAAYGHQRACMWLEFHYYLLFKGEQGYVCVIVWSMQESVENMCLQKLIWNAYVIL